MTLSSKAELVLELDKLRDRIECQDPTKDSTNQMRLSAPALTADLGRPVAMGSPNIQFPWSISLQSQEYASGEPLCNSSLDLAPSDIAQPIVNWISSMDSNACAAPVVATVDGTLIPDRPNSAALRSNPSHPMPRSIENIHLEALKISECFAQ